jgi:hypothetical protein
MTRTIVATGLGVALAAAMGLGLAAQATTPARLGLTDRDAREDVLRSVQNTNLVIGSAATRAFVALPQAARAAVVDAAYAWTRTYVDSDAFKADYVTRARNGSRHRPPSTAPSTKP